MSLGNNESAYSATANYHEPSASVLAPTIRKDRGQNPINHNFVPGELAQTIRHEASAGRPTFFLPVDSLPRTIFSATPANVIDLQITILLNGDITLLTHNEAPPSREEGFQVTQHALLEAIANAKPYIVTPHYLGGGLTLEGTTSRGFPPLYFGYVNGSNGANLILVLTETDVQTVQQNLARK